MISQIALGILIGAVGVYAITQRPHIVKPNSPSNLAILFKQALDNNDLGAVRDLMTKEKKDSFAEADLQKLNQYIKHGTHGEGGASFNTYLVMTFGNGKAITLYLAPPMNTRNNWKIQRIIEGANVTQTTTNAFPAS